MFQVSPHLYRILGLENFTPKEELKKAYRKLAVKHHPDKGGDLRKMQEINAAYNFLMKHKDEYDRRLKITQQPPKVVVNFTYTWRRTGGGTTSTTGSNIF